MRGRLFNIAAIGRAAGFAAIAAAIVATAIHFRNDDTGAGASLRNPSIHSDPLARELARCQAIAMAAKDDAGCEAAWAENRRRFFTYRPSPDHPSTTTAASPNGATPKSEGK
jgi:conjugative transfer region protein TrbK